MTTVVLVLVWSMAVVIIMQWYICHKCHSQTAGYDDKPYAV
ncbi:MAG: hypothetical protein ACXADB_04010 [Candidatus Hermodarchaeia archaeon]